MSQTIRVSLPGYNALTETDIYNYSIYADSDNILIKEKLRDTVSVSSTTNVAHNLSYVPLCFVFAEISSGLWRKLYSVALDGAGFWYELNSTNLVLRNTSGSAKTFSYYIFYDNIT